MSEWTPHTTVSPPPAPPPAFTIVLESHACQRSLPGVRHFHSQQHALGRPPLLSPLPTAFANPSCTCVGRTAIRAIFTFLLFPAPHGTPAPILLPHPACPALSRHRWFFTAGQNPRPLWSVKQTTGLRRRSFVSARGPSGSLALTREGRQV